MRRQLAADTGKWLGGRIALGLDTALGSRSDGHLGILMYHRVTDEIRSPPVVTDSLE